MSEVEDPVTTVVRLLQKNMHVVKDDGSLANIYVSKEWWNQEVLKNYDGQVTIGLVESQEQILELSAKTRRRLSLLRVNAWTTDKLEQSINGRVMREKIREEINRIIRQNRNKPDTTVYDFYGVGQTAETHKAYHTATDTEVTPQNSGWNELTDDDYTKIWYSDDARFSKTANNNGEYALMLFRFKIESKENVVKKIVLVFEGYGTAPAGNGVTIKVWNNSSEVWENAQAGTGEADETITIALTSNLIDYISSEGYLWLLARTTNPSDGTIPAILYCDYVSCTVTVNGITYCDVVSYRDLDQVQVKPFLWRTEFTIKTWLFENVGG